MTDQGGKSTPNEELFAPTIAILPPLASSSPAGTTTTTTTNTTTNNPPPPQPPPASFPQSSSRAPSAPSANQIITSTNNPNLLPDPQQSEPRVSSNWDHDSLATHCTTCHARFDQLFQRRHHCRLCGRLFCQECSNTRSLIPPSALVLKGSGDNYGHVHNQLNVPSFSPQSSNGDDSVTYVRSSSSSQYNNNNEDGGGADDTLLYGRGLERRILLARHPQRTCHPCRAQLAPLQEELCLRNSNAMRYNYIDEGDAIRRLCNSPLAFTLGHEVRKAAYTLANLLPKGGGGGGGGRTARMNNGSARLGAFLSTNTDDDYNSYPPPQADPCYAPNGSACKTLDPTLRNLDGMHIPAKLLTRAKGVAIVTSAKGGLGFAGFEFGTGLVVARRGNNNGENHGMDAWSAPSAIGIAGFAWGALVGAQVSDHVFLLMTEDAVRLFASDDGRSIQLGVDVGVAVGPMGRSAEADIGATTTSNNRGLAGGGSGSGIAMAPIYTYSLSKGLYAGISLDGRMVMARPRVNEKFYGKRVSAHELLSGETPTPPAAQPLYDALKRCRVYGGEVGGAPDVIRHANSSNSSAFDDGTSHSNGVSQASPNNNSPYTTSYGGPFPAGGLMERWSHTTGVGMPSASSSNSRNNAEPYNLSGRGEPPFMASAYDYS